MNVNDPMDAAARPHLPSGTDTTDFPHRSLITGESPDMDADIAIIWEPVPWRPDLLQAISDALAGNGGVFLMARDAAELVRARECVSLLICNAGSA